MAVLYVYPGSVRGVMKAAGPFMLSAGRYPGL